MFPSHPMVCTPHSSCLKCHHTDCVTNTYLPRTVKTKSFQLYVTKKFLSYYPIQPTSLYTYIQKLVCQDVYSVSPVLGTVTCWCPLKCNRWKISRVSNQNGVSLLYIMLEIHHSGREPSKYWLISKKKKKLHHWHYTTDPRITDLAVCGPVAPDIFIFWLIVIPFMKRIDRYSCISSVVVSFHMSGTPLAAILSWPLSVCFCSWSFETSLIVKTKTKLIQRSGDRIVQSVVCWVHSPAWCSLAGSILPSASGREDFPLELTWVLTPFPKNSFGWEYTPRSSLSIHAFHCADSKDPADIHVIVRWKLATKTHPACTIHTDRMRLTLWLD